MRRTIQCLLFCICSLAYGCTSVGSCGYASKDTVLAEQVALMMRLFEGQNEGKAPSSWTALETMFDRRLDAAFPHILPTRRYAFLKQPVAMPDPNEGVALIVGTRPFRDASPRATWYGGTSFEFQKLGRHVIYRQSDGVITHDYLPEGTIQEMFRVADASLPASDSEPERSWIRDARWGEAIGGGFVSAVAVLLGAGLIRLAKRSIANPKRGKPPQYNY